MKEMRRVLALVLCFVMLVGVLPVGAFAAEAETAEEQLIEIGSVSRAAAGTDDNADHLFFATDRHENTSIIGQLLTAIEEDLGDDRVHYVGLGGDMVNNTNSYKSSVVLEEVTAVAGNLDADSVDLVYAESHDVNCTDDAGIMNKTSGFLYETEYAYVYGVVETDVQYSESEYAPAAAAAFVEWANGVEDASKAILVLSHRPIHAKRGDNAGAGYWHNALNEVATGSATGTEVQRNVLFFHGHNHTVDSNEYYYAVGETMSVESYVDPSGVAAAAAADGTDAVIYYTYATAGYLNANKKATLVSIDEDTITLTKYGTSSEEVLGTVARVAEDTTPDKSEGTTVNTVIGTEATTQDTVTAVGAGLTGVALTKNKTADTSAFGDYIAYDVALEGYTEGETVTLTFDIGYMNSTDLVVYAGGIQVTPVSVEDYVDGDFYSVLVTVETTSATGTYVIGRLAAAEDAVLTGIAVTAMPETTSYTLVMDEAADGNIYLDITGLVVTAAYDNGQQIAVDWNEFDETKDGYALEFDISVAGTRTVKITYGGFETSFDVTVYEHNAEDADVAEAVAGVLKEGYIAKSFAPTDYTEGTKIRVVMPAPEGANVVYHVADDGTLTEIEDVTFHNGYVIFDTDHFSDYVVGESTNITMPDPDTATGSGSTTTKEEKEVYVLVSSPTAGNQYIIVSSGSAGSGYALKENTTTGTSVTINAASGSITAPYIETTDKTIMWNATSGLNFQSENGGYYLNYSSSGGGGGGSASYSLSFSTSSASDWTAGTNQLYRNGSQRDYWLRCNGSTWAMGASGTTYNVYFYEAQTIEVETTTTVSGTYSIAGEDISVIPAEGGTTTATLSSTLTFTPDSGTATTENVSTTATYEPVSGGDPNGVISGISGNTVTFSGSYGKALVKVSYTTSFGTVTNYITVEATAPYYTIELHKAELTKVTSDHTFNADNAYYIFDSVTNTYEEYVDISQSEFNQLVSSGELYTTPVISGDEITAPIVLKGVMEEQTYGVWAIVKEHTSENPDGVDMGSLGDALHWSVSDEDIATIDTTTGLITFTGNKYGTFRVTVSYEGADGKVITDTITISATESLYVVPGDGTNDFPQYPNEGAVRFDKTATAVGNYSETGIALVELSMTGVPFTSGNELDVVLMLDMTGSMSDEAMVAAEEAAVAFVAQIVKNEDGTYNDNRVAVYAFNSGSSSPYELVTLGTISSDTELEAANTAIRTASTKQVSGGTPYDEALEKCQEVLAEAKTTNLPDGVESAEDYDRQQFCVFMSDGGPTSYQYITNYDAVKAGTATAYTTASASASGGSNQSDSNFATIAGYTHEYYSTLMKDDEVTMFSVLTGLSADDYPNCATILENIASSSDNAYVVESGDDTSAVSSALSSIAQKILDAATNVVVEDKVGEKYSINFSVPGYGTENAVSADALDGLTEFYLQVVEYTLNADKERTGDPAVLENFTFNADGSFKSHTVNGVACTDCDHVTIENGVITAINGTYFSYENIEGDGEYLNWTADKITTTELALQYFAYLDNSTGVDAEDQVPAGTYYTNEYATLTYDNYLGNRVQQEFPIPQMTWNGAQVSYVFYLVNDAGQPVNLAGRVVPFAEATYVTDVHTYSVIWNDLEQSAGLEAKYLAEEMVPDVFALYDNDASYNIHVYEDEDKVNLNNHFIIGGDVTDEYNTSANNGSGWTNPKTTYVFNNKSDATKYNTVGAYVADDGDDDEGESNLPYLCKSAIIQGATYTTSVDASGVTVYTVTDLGSGYQSVSGETQVLASSLPSTTGATIIGGYAYYVDENGQVYTIVRKTNGNEAEKGFDFHNTTVAFAVVWKPELAEDTVVVDYGLDVVINVITNDVMAAGVVGVRADAPAGITPNSGTYESAKAQSADLYIDANNDNAGLKELKIGTATVENQQAVRFSLDTASGMQFTDPAVFYYEADCNFYDSSNVLRSTSMYSKVTVIPATTVYYEDSFLTLTGNWEKVGSTIGATQDVDRPGFSNVVEGYDANNEYGYDSAYDSCSTYSLGSAMKVTVSGSEYATAEFDFYGTGFDVISLTSNTSGTLTVKVKNADNKTVKNMIVDTYYGYEYTQWYTTYTYTADGWTEVSSTQTNPGNAIEKLPEVPAVGQTVVVAEKKWTVTENEENALYQIPVIKITDLEYAKYHVVITAAYNKIFDHAETGSYEVYLDAIRIYDPTGVAGGATSNEIVENAYAADKEGWPKYQELRNLILSAEDAASDEAQWTGAIFIDHMAGTYTITDYENYGPNNELYLASGQAIAFDLVVPANVADVQIGMKSADGSPVVVNLTNFTTNDSTNAAIAGGDSATDRYYSILSHVPAGNTHTIKFQNVGEGILSITNIKFTYTSEPTEEISIGITKASAGAVLMMMNASAEESEPEVVLDADLEVSIRNKNIKVGSNVVVKATTSADVAYLMVNGQKVTKYSENKNSGERSWSVNIKATEVGAFGIEVTAYGAEGEILETATETVEVTAKNGTVKEIVGQLIGMLGR